eukprot:TRINITY_DN18773_c0_g4_i1.p1 TRINITY_DN18773_c0_g4~~TRINITY_DN18773_c0_g4_i1.p1  ORF type:complete len:207 (+),score=62.74 TRINITY_DN18773_c0_g4_i1:68-688(+)
MVVRCTVGRSRLLGAGEGLFTAEECPRGGEVTRYHGRVISPAEFDKLSARKQPEARYAIELEEGRLLVPHRADAWEEGAAAHKANDARCLRVPSARGALSGDDTADFAAFQKESAAYLCPRTGSAASANAEFCRLDDGGWGLKALRDLAPGEEVFISYGYSYWLKPYVNYLWFRAERRDLAHMCAEYGEGLAAEAPRAEQAAEGGE